MIDLKKGPFAKGLLVALAISSVSMLSQGALAQGRKQDMVRYNGRMYDAGCLYGLSQNSASAGLSDEEYEELMNDTCIWTGVENPDLPPIPTGTVGSINCGSVSCIRLYFGTRIN